jgi:hypothetical protein
MILPKKKSLKKEQKNLKKYLKDGKFVLLRDIHDVFDQNKEESHDLLTKIMKGFWKGEYNLFFLPWLSPVLHIKREFNVSGKKKIEATVLTRELLRFFLLDYLTGKKRTEKREDLVSKRLEFIDGDDSLYKTFCKENWQFYQRIINKINRVFKNRCLEKFPGKDELTTDEENEAAGANMVDIINFNTLAIEIRDLINILKQPQFIKYNFKKILINFDQILDSKKLRKGHFLGNEFIFNRYLSFKEKFPEESDVEISERIYKTYFDGKYVGKINSPDRVRKIISEQKKKQILERLKITPPTMNLSIETIATKLAAEYFTTKEYVIDLYNKSEISAYEFWSGKTGKFSTVLTMGILKNSQSNDDSGLKEILEQLNQN